ncbi:MAG: GNAT family N-acetyltransferase, partial [Elainellaceae cyanobacterium]
SRLMPDAGMSRRRFWSLVLLQQQTSPNLRVRAARRQDIGSLSSLLADSFHPRDGLMGLVQPVVQFGIREDLRYRLQKPASHYACLVAVHHPESPALLSTGDSCDRHMAPKIVGTLELSVRRRFWWTSDRYLYISNLAVDRHHRRRGVARQLLQASEGVSRDWGLSSLNLHVMADNMPARQLYRRAGYTVQNNRTSFDGLFQRTEIQRTLFQRPQLILLRKDVS